ncbi:uncharacterized protein LOC122788362 [Protopterus annectens]|uniref:uncharacterized protein LOC122788362 n=1 Tax=Protopterus annectens TaxID=7888 RepID=UPI001CFB6F06|nr:uncharacterized protein LOC122788362 [Protopterus annectens]
MAETSPSEADTQPEWQTLEARSQGGENQYYNIYQYTMKRFPEDIHRFCHPDLPHLRRKELLKLLRSLDEDSELSCQRLQILFSFSVPSAEVLSFIVSLNVPIISAGAGTGYWEFLLQSRGVDVIAFDKNTLYPAEMRYMEVLTSGSEILEQFPERALLLAWPDAEESSTFSLNCLAHFKGDLIFHVGELLGETLSSNPWGQSTSADFQVALAQDFCCVSRIHLPAWPGHLDSFTVWRRKHAQPVICEGAHFHYVNIGQRVYL